MQESERLRLEKLRDDPNMPLVYLDISIKGGGGMHVQRLAEEHAAVLHDGHNGHAAGFGAGRSVCNGVRGRVERKGATQRAIVSGTARHGAGVGESFPAL